MPVGKGRVLSSTYEWEIDDYSSYSNVKTGQSIRSPSFNVQSSLWYLKLYPNGNEQDIQKYASLFLFMMKDTVGVGEIEAQYALTCLDVKKKVIATHCPDETVCFTNNDGWGESNFMQNSLLKDNPNSHTSNKIIIVCELIIKEVKLYKTLLLINRDRKQHFEDFKSQLNNSKFSDVTFTVENKEIHAHKMVLVAKSAVFAAMFEHKMQENEENKVTIEDISYKVFKELLTFLYTGECKMSEDFVGELFKAADKYQLLQLKDMCEEELCKNINVNNAITTLQLGDMYTGGQLKKEAIDFIALHGKEIVDKSEFESIENPKLLIDIFKGVFSVKN